MHLNNHGTEAKIFRAFSSFPSSLSIAAIGKPVPPIKIFYFNNQNLQPLKQNANRNSKPFSLSLTKKKTLELLSQLLPLIVYSSSVLLLRI